MNWLPSLITEKINWYSWRSLIQRVNQEYHRLFKYENNQLYFHHFDSDDYPEGAWVDLNFRDLEGFTDRDELDDWWSSTDRGSLERHHLLGVILSELGWEIWKFIKNTDPYVYLPKRYIFSKPLSSYSTYQDEW